MNYNINQNLLNSVESPIKISKDWIPQNSQSIINLSQGVPSEPPHFLLRELSDVSSQPSSYKYGDIRGYVPFRNSFKDDINTQYQSDISVNNVQITSGCNSAFYMVLIGLMRPNCNIVIQSPYYFNHKMTVDQLGVHSRYLPSDSNNSFIPNPQDVSGLVDENTVAVVLISPNNPTGTSIPPKVISDIHSICTKSDIPLIIDETYRSFSHFDKPHNLLSSDGLKNLISLHSFSKDTALPGARLGAIVASEDFLLQMEKVADCFQICPQMVAQIALSNVYSNLSEFKKEQSKSLIEKHKILAKIINSLSNGWSISSAGAYYAYVKYPYNINSIQVAETLAKKFGLIVLPGSFFTNNSTSNDNFHLRISVANVNIEMLEKSFEKLKAFDECILHNSN